MLRDENIEKITSYLDSIIDDKSKKEEYEALLTIANYGMNMDIYFDEKLKKHIVLWHNKKIPISVSFDDDLSKLLKYIRVFK